MHIKTKSLQVMQAQHSPLVMLIFELGLLSHTQIQLNHTASAQEPLHVRLKGARKSCQEPMFVPKAKLWPDSGREQNAWLCCLWQTSVFQGTEQDGACPEPTVGGAT